MATKSAVATAPVAPAMLQKYSEGRVLSRTYSPSRIAGPNNKICLRQSLRQQLLDHGLHNATAAEIQPVGAVAGLRNAANEQISCAVFHKHVMRAVKPRIP